MSDRKPMIVRINNLRVSIDEREALETLISVRLKIGRQQQQNLRIVRKALDARREGNIAFVYTVETEIPGGTDKWADRWQADKNVSIVAPNPETELVQGVRPLADRPVVVGFGPAGMFAALTLARHG